MPGIPAKRDASQQPDAAAYSLDQLALFNTYSRDSWRNREGGDGSQAPPFDPSRKAKRWYDPEAAKKGPSELMSYKIQGGTGSAHMVAITMTAGEAAKVNLMGVYTYPPYIVRPTGANTNPYNLTTLEEANALNAELNKDVTPLPPVEENNYGSATFPLIYPPDENRRIYQISFKGLAGFRVAALLQQKFAFGIGAPGHWDLSTSVPHWEHENQIVGENMTPVPQEWGVPLRDLLANEVITTHTPLGIPEVARTDRATDESSPLFQTGGASTGVGGASLVQMDTIVSMLQDLLAKVSQLLLK
jgi:hypothetical protein